ncbi:hypothetical protein KKH27_03185 [bacterium]|nr:hypothetical protein [bacterium]MBU1983005.1 hypothetical protein [bacterium]
MPSTATRTPGTAKSSKPVGRKTKTSGEAGSRTSSGRATRPPKLDTKAPSKRLPKSAAKSKPTPSVRRKPDQTAANATKKSLPMETTVKKKAIPRTKSKDHPAASKSRAAGMSVAEVKATKRTAQPRKATSTESVLRTPPRKKPGGTHPGETLFEPIPATKSEVLAPVEAFLEEDQDLVLEDEEEIVSGEIELDPMGIPIELLDPDLAEVPKPKLKPKPVKVERCERPCAGCGGKYTWLSVDGYCFSCLKRRLAQRKRDDESVTTYEPEADDDSES